MMAKLEFMFRRIFKLVTNDAYKVFSQPKVNKSRILFKSIE